MIYKMKDEELIKSESVVIESETENVVDTEEVEDPYFHLRDGNYIGGLTMP
jgi:hypothetical protein